MEAHKEMQDKANAESKKAKHRPRTSIMRDDPAGITNATSSISEKLKSLGAKAQYPHADGDYDGLPNIEENELELTRQKSKAVEEEFMPKNNDRAETQITRICVTGGPCAGKTTALVSLSQML